MRPFQHSFLSEERLLTFLASKEKIQNTSRLNFPDVRMTEFTRQIHSLHWTKFFLLFFQPFVVKWIGDDFKKTKWRIQNFASCHFLSIMTTFWQEGSRKNEEKFTTLNLLKRDWTYNQFGSIKKIENIHAKEKQKSHSFFFSKLFPWFFSTKKIRNTRLSIIE